MAISRDNVHLKDIVSYYQKRRGNTPNWNQTSSLLGKNLELMEYTENGYSFYGMNYAIECLMFSNSMLGTNIAIDLQMLNPGEPEDAMRTIWLTDVINPLQIPNVEVKYGEFVTFEPTSKDTKLYEDDRFLVGIVNAKDAIHLYFLKK